MSELRRSILLANSSGSNIYTFSVNGGGKFPFELGMTWEEYAETEYAKMAYEYFNYFDSIVGDKVGFSINGIGTCYLLYDGYVNSTDFILPDRDYDIIAQGYN